MRSSGSSVERIVRRRTRPWETIFRSRCSSSGGSLEFLKISSNRREPTSPWRDPKHPRVTSMAAQRYFVAWEKDVSRESWLIWSGPKFSLPPSLSLSLSKRILSVGKKRLLSNILSRSNVEQRQRWNWGNEGCFRYIYIWGELRVLRVLLPLKNFEIYSFARFSNFFDVNFYFIRVIQLFVSDIIYLFFFYITRRFKLKFVARFEFLCSTEFSRDYKIYVFMNIYFKKKLPSNIF